MDKSVLICPVCGSQMSETITDDLEIPHFGKVVHYFMKCDSCGFRINDFSYEGDHPKENRLDVRTKEDLYVKIVRGPSSTINIPELGLNLYPGPLAESFITNIEGLLERFRSLFPLFEDGKDKDDVAKNIERAINGELKFTVVIKDPSGVSHFIQT